MSKVIYVHGKQPVHQHANNYVDPKVWPFGADYWEIDPKTSVLTVYKRREDGASEPIAAFTPDTYGLVIAK